MTTQTRSSNKTLTIFLVLIAIPGLAVEAGSGNPHLNVINRTASEIERIAKVTEPTNQFDKAEPYESLPAGAATVKLRQGPDAFSQSSGNMPFERELDFKVGNGLFKKLWVSSPSSTLASDGLGPVYNARSCQRCHLKDGRGHPPENESAPKTSMFLRVSIPKYAQKLRPTAPFETLPEPTYGEQFQDFAVSGIPAEGRWDVTYEEISVELADGTTVSLRKPKYNFTQLNYGEMHPDVLVSPRVAPQMIGLGLLEAIPEENILQWSDPDDADGDGISGRPNWVRSPEFPNQKMLGRFGLKAGAPTVLTQSAGAFSGDMGISSPLFPGHSGECTTKQSNCIDAPHGNSEKHDGFEISAEGLELVAFYARNLAVPERRDVEDAGVLAGKKLFYEARCIACHRPKYVTHRLKDRPEQSFQLIWPYTDMLLHDMGEGLADFRPESEASGVEWRTPPLWGIGLTETVSNHSYFLHDGRARSLTEAILWHGGEAQFSRDQFAAMSEAERSSLVRFLRSL